MVEAYASGSEALSVFIFIGVYIIDSIIIRWSFVEIFTLCYSAKFKFLALTTTS